jgi:hypothetical protein
LSAIVSGSSGVGSASTGFVLLGAVEADFEDDDLVRERERLLALGLSASSSESCCSSDEESSSDFILERLRGFSTFSTFTSAIFEDKESDILSTLLKSTSPAGTNS